MYGVKFHIEGSRQAESDAMKNEIFNKYGLPLLRFRTDESDERKHLIKALDMINWSQKNLATIM